MLHHKGLATLGAATLTCALVLPAHAAPAQLRIRTPGLTADVTEEIEGGHRVERGDTGTGDRTVVLSGGLHRICVSRPELGTVCRDLELTDGETVEWILWPAELGTVPATVELPAAVVAVRVVVGGEPRERIAADSEVSVPPLRDVWLEMIDAQGRTCLCHPPPLPALERYRCPWLCGTSSGSTRD